MSLSYTLAHIANEFGTSARPCYWCRIQDVCYDQGFDIDDFLLSIWLETYLK